MEIEDIIIVLETIRLSCSRYEKKAIDEAIKIIEESGVCDEKRISRKGCRRNVDQGR